MGISVLGVIPARYASVRFPGKPLAKILGRSMIQWVYEAASASSQLSRVVVATEDHRIKEVVESFGGEVVMTSPHHLSGSDRIGEVMGKIPAEIYVNIQGDEPLLHPAAIDSTIQLVTSNRYEVASAMTPMPSLDDLNSPHVVKVITNEKGSAIYFSRFPIPYSRVQLNSMEIGQCFPQKHLGLYVYRRTALEKFLSVPATSLEKAESLEQLRFLWCGVSIGLVSTPFDSIGVDVPDDIAQAEKRLLTRKES